MRLSVCKIIFFALLVPTAAFSQSRGKAKLFMFEINSLFGWGSSQRAGDAVVPAIGTFGLGVGVGINIKKITLGLSYDYRILTQYSEVDPAVGNRRGTFISPTSLLLRVNFEKIRFGLVLINNGTYELTNITADGKKITYTGPGGFRFDLIFKKFRKITPMIFFESVSFSGMQLDGVTAASSSNLSYTNYGAGIKYEF